jgi:hypothetical protein
MVSVDEVQATVNDVVTVVAVWQSLVGAVVRFVFAGAV